MPTATATRYAALPTTLAELKKLIAFPEGFTAEDYKANAALYDGKHFDETNPEKWEDVLPQEPGPEREAAIAVIKAAFASQNMVKEVVNRARDGVIGLNPHLSIDPTRGEREGRNEEDDEEDDGLKLLREAVPHWWGDLDIRDAYAEAVRNALLGTKGGVRFYPAPLEGENGEEVKLSAKSVEEGLSLLRANSLAADQVEKLFDSRTGRPFTVCLFKDSEGKEAGEACYVNDQGLTTLRYFGSAAGATAQGLEYSESEAFDLGGKLFVYVIELEAMVTPQIRQQQHALNRSITVESMNEAIAAFRDRTFLGAAPNGEYYVDEATGQLRFRPSDEPLKRGPQEDTFVQGVATLTKDGEIRYERPSVHIADPIPGEHFEGTQGRRKRSIYEEARQRFVMIVGDTDATGRAKEIAIWEFVSSLREAVRETEAALAGVDMAIRFAHEVQTANRVEGYRATPKVRIDAGPVTKEQVDALSKRYNDGTLSRLSYIERSGEDNAAGELARIRREEDSDPKALAQRAEIFAKLTDKGLSNVEAATLAGFSEEQIAALKAAGSDDPEREVVQ